jgi:hypothetical protein
VERGWRGANEYTAFVTAVKVSVYCSLMSDVQYCHQKNLCDILYMCFSCKPVLKSHDQNLTTNRQEMLTLILKSEIRFA